MALSGTPSPLPGKAHARKNLSSPHTTKVENARLCALGMPPLKSSMTCTLRLASPVNLRMVSGRELAAVGWCLDACSKSPHFCEQNGGVQRRRYDPAPRERPAGHLQTTPGADSPT